ncbi:hypothetical protein COLO4_19642 [Corchorus olitorius]|uniref:Cardiolipin synthase N-terminal domain-containing protein n=1 Tax=Corchorus olitorius TaxID=93759 RepID=A0A1R3J497_9ROSI|nr:hypothetical protein COLO4_19642 [Corchorus olitorius]
MLASTNLICCNFSHLPQNSTKFKPSIQVRSRNLSQLSLLLPKTTSNFSVFLKPHSQKALPFPFHRKGVLQICQSTLNTQDSEEETSQDKGSSLSNGEEGRDWTTSILLFVLWGALMYYVFNLTPDQTPSRDLYFLKKLLNLKGDDGFRMNEVLVSLWYIMGLWPLVYSMLLLPTGRSSKSSIPTWPFLVLSCFGGAYALLPYFVLWSPPPPPVEEDELKKWPLNILESKLTAAIHITTLDFSLLSAFAPFWVYNDMTARKWYDKGFWLLPLSLVPFLGPALYLVLRPSLSELPVTISQTTSEQK